MHLFDSKAMSIVKEAFGPSPWQPVVMLRASDRRAETLT